MNKRINGLRDAVETEHQCKANHIDSVPLREMSGDALVWEGVVERFSLSGHPQAHLCYAWTVQDGNKTRYVTVLKLPPVESPKTAVRAAIASKAQK